MVNVTIVESPACRLCEDAKTAVQELASEFTVELRVVDISSEEGRALLLRHRPPMQPLVLVDGEWFSCGRLPRGKLRRLLLTARRA